MFGINDNSENDNSGQPDETAASDTTNEAFDGPGASPAPADQPSPAHDEPDHMPADDKPSEPSDDDLINLKEQALNSLSPLLNHLEQTPEEHFRTLMMLIQASDNSGLIKEAYEAANKITDEKSRAQALLDVVNEINYFTQKDDKDEA